MTSAQNRPFSWMSPKLEVQETGKYGKGVFAKADIKKDETLIVMGGYILTIEDENNLEGEAVDKPIELSNEFSIGPLTAEDLPLMPQHYVNHSCNPNAGFFGQIFLVAMKDISVGEEICYDYAMVMHPSEQSTSFFSMPCLCEAASCRKIITEKDWQIPELQDKYAGYFQYYLEQKIKEQKSK